MRAVIQRVKTARVDIDGQTVASIGGGLLVFLGIGKGDSDETLSRLAAKISRLRIFSDENGKMNLSVRDIRGQVLVVSQFTLYADCSRGNRPGFEQAGEASEARRLVEYFIQSMKDQIGRAHV